MLLRRPEFMASAQEAARTDDDELLWRCLFERRCASNPSIRAVPECAKDYTIADGIQRAKDPGRTGAGEVQSACSTSAGSSNEEIPSDAEHEYMLFGYGLHGASGRFLAGAQITQTLKPLLKKRGSAAPRADGQMQTIGLMPAHLSVEFDP